jgi:hypothetical protein
MALDYAKRVKDAANRPGDAGSGNAAAENPV